MGVNSRSSALPCLLAPTPIEILVLAGFACNVAQRVRIIFKGVGVNQKSKSASNNTGVPNRLGAGFMRLSIAAVTVGLLGLLNACSSGSSSSTNPVEETNAPTTVYISTPDAAGSVTGTNRVVANKSYSYSAVAANGVPANYSWSWGDGTAPSSVQAASANQDKIWRAAGNYTASLSLKNPDGSVLGNVTQSVAVVDQPVSSGMQHSCAILSDNSVACWGRNSYGEAGTGTISSEVKTPTVVAGLTSVVALSVFGHSTCAAKSDGTVWCWGEMAFDREGGIAINDKLPQRVTGLADIVALTGSNSHACALERSGGVKCWGRNALGALGNAALNDPSYAGGVVTTPVQVTALSDAVQIAAGDNATCAILKTGGDVKCWGSGSKVGPGRHVPSASSQRVSYPVDVPNVTNAIRLSMSRNMSCANLADGSVKCWGIGLYGQSSTTGVAETATVLTGINNVTSLSLGDSHACALKTDGTVSCWGNYYWFAKLDADATQTAPTAILDGTGAALSNVMAISSGWGHTCAAKEDGSVYCWGWNGQGQLGDGLLIDRVAASPALTSNIGEPAVAMSSSAIALGAATTCAVKSNKDLTCWGSGSKGTLADGTNTPISLPTTNALNNGYSQLTLGSFHGCAVNAAGNVVCWGQGGQGQLGNGSNQNQNTPVLVKGLNGQATLSGVVSLSANSNVTCAVLPPNGEVACWGQSINRFMGAAVTTNQNVPTLVPGLTGVMSVSLSYYSACALKADGTVQCWGNDFSGSIGRYLFGQPFPYAPGLVSGLTDAIGLSAGTSRHVCALKSNRTVVCWGNNSYGVLGISSNLYYYSFQPRLIPNVSNVKALSSGDQLTCALDMAGGVKCWGNNDAGQLGGGIFQNYGSSSAVTVLEPNGSTPLSGVSVIAASERHACAIKSNGDVVCWGSNLSGQLGLDQSFSFSSRPAKVNGIIAQVVPPRTFWK
jgi:alpha-tubulin suppressor-like RCC1 family protein